MNTVIIVTLIICSMLVVMRIINAFETAQTRNDVNRQINKFDKAFPTVKPTEKRTDNANDDLPKFGD